MQAGDLFILRRPHHEPSLVLAANMVDPESLNWVAIIDIKSGEILSSDLEFETLASRNTSRYLARSFDYLGSICLDPIRPELLDYPPYTFDIDFPLRGGQLFVLRGLVYVLSTTQLIRLINIETGNSLTQGLDLQSFLSLLQARPFGYLGLLIWRRIEDLIGRRRISNPSNYSGFYTGIDSNDLGVSSNLQYSESTNSF